MGWHRNVALNFVLLVAATICWSGTAAQNATTGGGRYVAMDGGTTNGQVSTGQLRLTGGSQNLSLGPDVPILHLTVDQTNPEVLHLKLEDVVGARWQVPRNLLAGNVNMLPGAGPKLYNYQATNDPFGFLVSRTNATNGVDSVLFNTNGLPLVYKEQYLELTTSIPASASLYGMGERTQSFGLKLPRDGVPRSMWARDEGSANPDTNVYGDLAFYMDVRKDGSAHGVFMLNSNGKDFVFNETSFQYRMIGGVIDMYILAGPTPDDVMRQYTDIVGKPHQPPYWSLGFHNCRYGYTSVAEVAQVVANYSAADIPLETMWIDIDYMNGYKIFTLDPVLFSPPDMNAFLKSLHDAGQHFVPIVDPGISIETNNTVYENGLQKNVYVKDYKGDDFLGQVWPGAVNWPDFFHPNATTFWSEEMQNFHDLVPYDGVWIDMNEAANFAGGHEVCTVPANRSRGIYFPEGNVSVQTTNFLNCSDDTLLTGLTAQQKSWIFPPYNINNGMNQPEAPWNLSRKTLGMAAMHYGNIPVYDAHDLYGHTMGIATRQAMLDVLPGRRPFILSRSTFPGSGAYVAHWTGDNAATWGDLQWSVSSIINSGLYGIPFVGADICGFAKNTTAELCARWISAGAFTPFARDHNVKDAIPQELYRWPETILAGKKALGMRYQLLSYLYSAMTDAHLYGCPAARPLFYSFPADSYAREAPIQWLLGDGVMISPVMMLGMDTTEAYFPAGTWYSIWNHTFINTAGGGAFYKLTAPIGDVPVHVLGGNIIPMQAATNLTSTTRVNPINLLVALPKLPGPSTEKATAVADGNFTTSANWTAGNYYELFPTTTPPTAAEAPAPAAAPVPAPAAAPAPAPTAGRKLRGDRRLLQDGATALLPASAPATAPVQDQAAPAPAPATAAAPQPAATPAAAPLRCSGKAINEQCATVTANYSTACGQLYLDSGDGPIASPAKLPMQYLSLSANVSTTPGESELFAVYGRGQVFGDMLASNTACNASYTLPPLGDITVLGASYLPTDVTVMMHSTASAAGALVADSAATAGESMKVSTAPLTSIQQLEPTQIKFNETSGELVFSNLNVTLACPDSLRIVW